MTERREPCIMGNIFEMTMTSSMTSGADWWHSKCSAKTNRRIILTIKIEQFSQNVTKRSLFSILIPLWHIIADIDLKFIVDSPLWETVSRHNHRISWNSHSEPDHHRQGAHLEHHFHSKESLLRREPFQFTNRIN